MSALSDYLENKLIDFLLRAQAFVPPATLYVALYTTNQNDADSGEVEVTGGSYARVAITSSLANWAGTQAAASTSASSGSSGTTSNNAAITFPAPTANWGTITGMAVLDASSGGNLWWYCPLTTPKTVNNGDAAPSFAAAALSLQLDN
jgi:hypothetical protein